MDYKIYSVHGTFAADTSQRGNRWWQKESRFSDAVLSYLDTNTYRVRWEPFRWSGENKSSERGKAAMALAQVLSQVDHRTNKVALFAHSHGGNVVYTARNIANQKSKIPELPVVTVGTPFIPEVHSNSWLFEKLPKLWWTSAYVFVACLIGLWFTEAGTLASKGLVIFSIVSVATFGLSLYIKAVFAFTLRIFSSHFSRKKQGLYGFLLRKLYHFDEKTRRNNIKDPKIYSLNDEAINALRAVPSQEINLASNEIAVFPAALILSVAVFVTGVLALPQTGITLPGDVLEDFAVISRTINIEHLSWLNDISKLLVLLALSSAIGFLCSRLFLSRWAARIFNKLFTQTLKERAYGRDTGIIRAFPMFASANLPLVLENYRTNEEWKPIPKSLDDDLDEITINSATGMFRAIRETLGMGVTTGSYTFSETISTNFRGDELVHSAYFEHPDLPGFLAWILCEFYEFPKGCNYADLPIDKFQEWWDAIRPDPWPKPAEQNAQTDH